MERNIHFFKNLITLKICGTEQSENLKVNKTFYIFRKKKTSFTG